MCPMRLNCFLDCSEFAGHLLIKAPSDNQRHDFPLSWGQPCESPTQHILLAMARIRSFRTLDRKLDRTQQVHVTHRLRQEIASPSLHRVDGHRNVAVPRDEYDGKRAAQFALQLKS